jgi:DNA-binding CsgD family transcriptional regulator
MAAGAAFFNEFQNRTDELAYLKAAFRRAVRGESGTTMLLPGESGVGKSRLLREFERTLALERCLFATGCCLDYVQIPYGPFLDALRGDRGSTDVVRLLQEAAQNSNADTHEQKYFRFSAVESYLRRRAATAGALILILEDVHWSDLASLELLHHLSRRLNDVAVLLIASYRSDELERDTSRAPLLARLIRDGAEELRLNPLAEGEIAVSLRRALPPGVILAQRELARICELAEGKPLIAEELLRDVIDRTEGGRTSPHPTLISIRDAVMKRVHTLSEAEQQMLMQAAVVGREFSVGLLGLLAKHAEEVVLHMLRKARALQLVREVGRDRFTFRHAITREILYQELLSSEARSLHERIAVVLEGITDSTSVEELAYHWYAAEVPEKAVLTNVRAAERATSLAAFADAAKFYERAIRFVEATSSKRDDLFEKIIFSLYACGDLSQARAWSEKAADEHRFRGDTMGAMRLMLKAARHCYNAGDSQDALQMVSAIRSELEGLPVDSVHFAAEVALAMIVTLHGHPSDGLAILDRAALFRCEKEPAEMFRALTIRGLACAALDRFDESLAAQREALHIGERVNNTDFVLHAHINIGHTFACIGRTQEALVPYETGYELAERAGFGRMRGMFSAFTAYCAFCAGDLARAATSCLRVLNDQSPDIDALMVARATAMKLAEFVDGWEGHHKFEIEEALDIAYRRGEPQSLGRLAGAAASLLLADADVEKATNVAARAMETLIAPDYVHWLCDVTAGLDTGYEEKARAFLATWEAGGANLAGVASARLYDARRAKVNGREDVAQKLAREAHTLFLKLPWPLEAAMALEIANDRAGAVELYKRLGATRKVRELSPTRQAKDGAAHHLTKREAQVARLAAQGHASKAIALQLGIGERTVESHIAAIYQKLGARTRLELMERMRTLR